MGVVAESSALNFQEGETVITRNVKLAAHEFKKKYKLLGSPVQF